MSEDNAQAMALIADEINKSRSSKVIAVGQEDSWSDVKFWIPSGSVLLDLICGGGIPCGRMIELFGDPGEGKSTTIEHAMIGVQKSNGISALIDSESKFDRHRAIKMGHDESKHLQLMADSVETGFELIEESLRSIREKPAAFRKAGMELLQGAVPDLAKKLFPTMIPRGGLVTAEAKQKMAEELESMALRLEESPVLYCWDTISAAPPRAELAVEKPKVVKPEEVGKVQEVRLKVKAGMMEKPRLVRAGMRKLSTMLPRYKAGIIFGSQIIQSPDTYGPGWDSASGGDGVKFHATIRLHISRIGKYLIGEKEVGIISSVKAIKNQLAVPNKKVNLFIRFETGFDVPMELFMYLVEFSKPLKNEAKIIDLHGSYYRLHNYPEEGKTLQFYQKELHDVVESDPGVLEFMKMQTQAAFNGLLG